MNRSNYSRGCIVGDVENSTNYSCSDSACCYKLDVFNWIDDLPNAGEVPEVVEVRFKNTRKEFFVNVNKLPLRKGDIVAVEASPGHDIGIVSLTGFLIENQLKKYNLTRPGLEFKKIYRKAKPTDIQKWQEAISFETSTMLKARIHARELGLNMKIGDVEFQGDRTRAVFYYIAEERVDFRELIKILAEIFMIRVEMKQIGARQEAGRIGGIGPCGRELCCTTWMSNFNSVSTNSARIQDLSMNPQKLAGQCGKLKCCLNYELDTYKDALKGSPNTNIVLNTKVGNLYHFKTDILRGFMYYSTSKDMPVNLVLLSKEKVKEIIEINRTGESVEEIIPVQEKEADKSFDFTDVVGQESLTRFDKKKTKKKKKKRSNKPNTNRGVNNVEKQKVGTTSKPRQNSRPNPKKKVNEVVKSNTEKVPNANQNANKVTKRPNTKNNKPRPRPRPRPNNNAQKNDNAKTD